LGKECRNRDQGSGLDTIEKKKKCEVEYTLPSPKTAKKGIAPRPAAKAAKGGVYPLQQQEFVKKILGTISGGGKNENKIRRGTI